MNGGGGESCVTTLTDQVNINKYNLFIFAIYVKNLHVLNMW